MPLTLRGCQPPAKRSGLTVTLTLGLQMTWLTGQKSPSTQDFQGVMAQIFTDLTGLLTDAQYYLIHVLSNGEQKSFPFLVK